MFFLPYSIFLQFSQRPFKHKFLLDQSLGFKYQLFTPNGCKDEGFGKLEFVAKTFFGGVSLIIVIILRSMLRIRIIKKYYGINWWNKP